MKMANFSSLYCLYFCLVLLKGLESSNIYVIKVPTSEDIVTNSQDYDDYGVTYEDDSKSYKYNLEKQTSNNDKAKILFCQRLFGSMYENKEQHIRCLQALKKDPPKNLDKTKFLNPFKIIVKESGNRVGRQQYKPFIDLSFSQDYLDVNDLARSEFASDYVDVGDFKGTRSIVADCKVRLDEFGQLTRNSCNPASRKSSSGRGNFRFKVEDSTEILKDEKNGNLLRTLRNKRYKVVSNESDKSRESSQESKSDNDDFRSDASLQDSDSIEVTTKKPKKKKKSKKSISDSYMYMQGNKFYNQEDFRRNKLRNFGDRDDVGDRNDVGDGDEVEDGNENSHSHYRRGLRMSHFLPKRYHWDEDDFQNLGYYWFNGPRGKYKRL